MKWRHPGTAYSTSGLFTKNKERIQKFKETGYSRYIIQNELDKAHFQYDMTYGDFIDLTRKTVSDELLHNEAVNIVKNPKYDGYQKGLPSMFFWQENLYQVYKYTNRFAGISTKNENLWNKELAEELHKSIIKNKKIIKLHSLQIDKIWVADLAHMQLVTKFNKQTVFLLFVNDIF